MDKKIDNFFPKQLKFEGKRNEEITTKFNLKPSTSKSNENLSFTSKNRNCKKTKHQIQDKSLKKLKSSLLSTEKKFKCDFCK